MHIYCSSSCWPATTLCHDSDSPWDSCTRGTWPSLRAAQPNQVTTPSRRGHWEMREARMEKGESKKDNEKKWKHAKSQREKTKTYQDWERWRKQAKAKKDEKETAPRTTTGQVQRDRPLKHIQTMHPHLRAEIKVICMQWANMGQPNCGYIHMYLYLSSIVKNKQIINKVPMPMSQKDVHTGRSNDRLKT